MSPRTTPADDPDMEGASTEIGPHEVGAVVAGILGETEQDLRAHSGLAELPNPTAPAVLVVNDRLAQRVALRAMLAPLSLVLVEVDSGSAAVSAAQHQTFALILMDVRMPTMDGYQTARVIRQREETRQTPIMFVTAFGPDDTDTLTAYAIGAVDFIFTPVVADVLRAKVKVFVDLFVQSQEVQRSLASITELNAALRDSEASTRAVLDNVADGLLITDERQLIESCNRSALALFGYRQNEVAGQELSVVVAPERQDEFRASAELPQARAGEMGRPGVTTETLGCRHDRSTFPMEVERSELVLGTRRLTLTFVRDITARKAYTDALKHQALHDGLTGLANRTLFGEHASQSLASAKRTGESRAILVMDVDGFKQVNDTLGHDQGDALLKQLGERLVIALRETDTIARLGGDEFAILPGDATDLAAADAVAWKIQRTFATGFDLGDETVHVKASIGIAIFPEHGKTPAELLRLADAAMYVAKRSGSGHAVAGAAQEPQTSRQLDVLVGLRGCIARDEMILHYQPKIDLMTREISGVEALIRWQHRERGLLLPGSFMSELERTDLITSVTHWVLSEALRQQQFWRDAGIDLTMAVNISARSLGPRSSLPDSVQELTRTWGTPPDRLILELTEGALIEAHASGILARLHDMGARLSIDDFGTGYSSLPHLQRLPVDEIKIDRSFVTSLSVGGDDDVLIRSTIELAHNLSLTVVAQGVEDANVLQILADHECDAVQGYFLGRPAPAEELTAQLTESPYGATAGAQ
jgi:diguanylate cyclase (GGDEF)-like protein/PAS domain S-box-containing protein